MSKIIQNKIMWIYGLPGSWKTFFAMFLQSFYPRVYSNVDFIRFDNFWKVIKKSTRIEHMRDLNAIKFEDRKWIAILDEGWVNISSRRSMSDSNLEFLELWMLWRKKNIDILVISQLERSIDVVMRELCKVSFTMQEFWENHRLLFEAKITGRNDDIKWFYNFDLIKFANLTGWTYDTKDESRIKKDEKKKDDEIGQKYSIKEILNI